MSDAKISALTNYSPPITTDVLPIVDVTTPATKKITIANLTAYIAALSETLTNKVISAATLSGAGSLSAGATFALAVPTSAGATGPVTSAFNSGYTSTAIGDLVYLDTSTTWQKADNATSAATKAGILAIALSVAASGAAPSVALSGSFIFATAWNLATVGAPVYMGTSAGITLTAPITTDSATRVIGWVVASGNGTTKIWFQPSPDYTTHT